MNILNKLVEIFLFNQTIQLIKKGRQRPIEASDALVLPEELNAKNHLFDPQLLRVENGIPLVRSIFKQSRPHLVKGGSLYFVSQTLALLTPLLIFRFIEILNNAKVPPKDSLGELLILATGIAVTGYISGLLMQHYFYSYLKLQQRIVSLLNERIFNTSLGLSAKSRNNLQSGDVVNLMSSDSDAVSDSIFIVSQFLVNLFVIFGALGLLFHFFGLATLAAVVVMALLFPISRKIAMRFNRCDEEIMRLRDHRVTLMGQILNAIRIVKYFAWEKSVQEEVSKIRKGEVKSRIQLVKAETLSSVIYMASSSIVLFATLATYAALGHSVSLPLIFAGLSLFSILEEPLGDMTNILARWINAKVSAHRISEFLRKEVHLVKRFELGSKAPRLNAHELHFSYGEKAVLKNLTFEVLPGEKLAIIGPVGSGKSTLLQMILREITANQGNLAINDKLTELPAETAYVAQESYIINGTLEENILFGTEINSIEEKQLRLDQALHLSGLEQDIRSLQMGLRTEIGERGINLSGGQKQRLSLARSIIKNPLLVILDDAVSAIDFLTEQKIMRQLIFGEWQKQTLVFATHRLEHLSQFDKVLFLENGEQIFFGSFSELQKQKRYQEFITQAVANNSTNNSVELSSHPLVESSSETHLPSTRITEDEDQEKGNISSDLFLSYIRLLGGKGKYASILIGLLFLAAVIAKILPLIQKAWLSHGQSPTSSDVIQFLGIYFGLSVITLVGFYLNNIFWYHRGIQAGVQTHDSSLRAVLHAPIRFFDSTPVGRLLQRFSRDLDSVDSHLMFSHISAIDCFIQIMVSTLLIVLVMPITLLVIAPIIGIYYFVQLMYRSTAREIKRIDSVARSPRYAHFKETLQGLPTIRAFHQQTWFESSFFTKLNFSQRMFYNHYMVNRWFSVRVPLLGGLIVLSAGLAVVWTVQSSNLSAASAGLILVYAMAFWRYLNWGVRVLSDIEARMTSVERLNSLARLAPEEKSFKPFTGNLNKGDIEFENVMVRYAPHLPWVLKGLSFKIKEGERVGIIGKTGSGKSTIFQTLFRFIEHEQGEIKISGHLIQTLPLEVLRRALAIIPQDPTLFMGTIRSNLDRYSEYSESEIMAVLEQTQLKELIETLPQGLKTPVSENGLNFSQGQRQLFCLARALLIKAKFLVLDEATASVDVETDRLIQNILRSDLRSATQLIIAHRLETIADCDQIFEIHQGQLVERTVVPRENKSLATVF
jgi:ABC-type multidrug transport system fused ATPase/permease subunit